MFESGKFVYKYIEGAEPNQVQPNGVDLKLERLFLLRAGRLITFDEEGIEGLNYWELNAPNSYFILERGSYLGILKEKVTIPKGYIGLYFPRSSMFRMGILTERSLFDTGFIGFPRVLLTVVNDVKIRIKKNVRVGQITFVKSKYAYLYNGSYQEGDLDENN